MNHDDPGEPPTSWEAKLQALIDHNAEILAENVHLKGEIRELKAAFKDLKNDYLFLEQENYNIKAELQHLTQQNSEVGDANNMDLESVYSQNSQTDEQTQTEKTKNTKKRSLPSEINNDYNKNFPKLRKTHKPPIDVTPTQTPTDNSQKPPKTRPLNPNTQQNTKSPP